MNKKKGFTLVELLAVIVILAIIALIATPIILNVIEEAKKGAAKDSFNGYMSVLELSLAQKEMKGEIQLKSGRYNVTKDTIILDILYPSINEIVDIKGDKPTGTNDYIVLDDKKNVTEAELTISGYVIKYENGEINSITKTGEIGIKNIKLNFDNQTMEKGSTFEIKVECEPSDATNQKVVYTSNDKSIAKVDENGLVTALKAGTTKIIVTSEANKSIKKEISITVIVSATGLTLNKESDEIYVSETVQLIGTLEPSDATTNALSWISSNPLVASVDENGLVTGRSEGEAVVTATTQNNITATFNVKINKIPNYTYEYVDGTPYYTFVAPINGTYKIELWGAQGGGEGNYLGGLGAYVSGNINLEKGKKLYIYVGESGNNSDGYIYNNGNMKKSYSNKNGYAGGGATDIRLVNGEWNTFESLKSRIMVAAGGGGSTLFYYASSGGAAGGLSGYSGYSCCNSSAAKTATGGTQILGGVNGGGINTNYEDTNGHFGSPTITTASGIGYGGNGYYAGGVGAHGSSIVGSGAGGSSFISGHEGCDAIDKSSTSSNIIHTGQSTHYSGYKFTDTLMIDGNGYEWTTERASTSEDMPTHDGTSTMTGNSGNGYAKITFISN